MGPANDVNDHSPLDALTFPQLLGAMAASYGDKPAVVLGDRTLTFRQLDEESRHVAYGLLRRGVGKGTRVGVLGANSPRWVVWFAAVTRIGAVAVPLSTFLKPPELARVVRHADLHAVLCQHRFLDHDFVQNFETAFPDLGRSGPELELTAAPFLRWMLVEGSPAHPAWARTTTWLDAGSDAARRDALLGQVEREVVADDPAIMIYTSGQSAAPKGVVHSHANTVGKTHYLREMLGYCAENENVAVQPFFWVGGLVMTLLTTLEIGGTVRCTDGATRATPQRPASGYTAFPGLGMTETFGMYAWGTEPPHPERPLCTPMTIFDPQIEPKVCDPSGNPVDDGHRGEMVVRGRGVTLGLHKVPRSERFHPAGFYRTGDECLVEDGVTYFLGRLGDMIKTSGANVSPAEVEHELLALDGVDAAHVVGIDDDARGQIVGAAVVSPDTDVGPEISDVVRVLRQRLSSYKVPRLIALLGHDELPLTPALKVDRRRLVDVIRERGIPDRAEDPARADGAR